MIFHGKNDRPIVTLLPLCAWLLLAPVATGWSLRGEALPFAHWLNLFLGTVFISPFVTAGLRAIYIFAARHRFLREHSPTARLPVHYSEASWFEQGERWNHQAVSPTADAGENDEATNLPPWRGNALFLPRVHG